MFLVTLSLNLKLHMRVALAADHAGYVLKSELLAQLTALGEHEALDLGAFDQQPSDYPDFARRIAEAIRSQRAERGILICGSGVGGAIAANKFHDIRAGLCHDHYSAHQGVEHDAMNVLCLGSRVIGSALAAELVKAFLGASFSGESRHRRRLEKIKAIEQEI